MDKDYLDILHRKLQMWSVSFAPGLTDEEVSQIEARYGFRFPPDLRAFLQYALPISSSWVNWRDDAEEKIRSRLDWPAEGICFDIQHNDFWMDTFGPKPADLEEAFRIARQAVANAPRLIPILSHRYLPDEPNLAGNPVFSVYQTDIIHYGYDLASYFANEFRIDPEKLPDHYLPCPEWAAKSPHPIRFWDQFL